MKRKIKMRLNTKLLGYLMLAMTWVAILLLAGNTLAGWEQYKKLYNEKSLQIARMVADQLDGDFIEKLNKEINTDDFKAISEEVIKTEKISLYVDWLKEKKMYEDYKKADALIQKIQNDMDIKYLYVQVIHDGYGTYILDSDSSYLSLGFSEKLKDEFAGIEANSQLEPTVSHTEFGWLSSSGEPIVDSTGKKCAVVYVDIDMTEIVENLISLVTIMVLLCILSVLFVGVLISYRVRKGISLPIEQLTEATDAFGNGENGYNKENVVELDIHTGDEIQKLYKATKHMQENIIDYMDNLEKVTKEREQISAELNVATQIQANMLPRIFPPFPDKKEFDIYATMTPAKEVGGDFYDFFFIDDKHLALVMADVSGKGVPAALFMVIAKTLIKNQAQSGNLSPADILTKVNSHLCEGNDAGYFVTVWLAVIDITTGKGLAANAGHEHPTLCRAGGQYELVVYRHSPAVAIMEGINYKEHEFEMKPGDSLYVYTDGVVEATDLDNQLFGTDRMLAALNKNSEDSPEEILHSVKEEIDTFVGEAPQFDDITMMSFRYNGF